MSSISSLNNSSFGGSIAEKSDGPDLSYSFKTKAAIIGSVALCIIGTVGIALVTCVPGALGFLGLVMAVAGLTFGLGGVPLIAYFDRVEDVAHRIFNYADGLEEGDKKILWMGKAAERHIPLAIEKEFNMGKKLMLDSILETEETKMQKYQKGLNTLHSALNHCYSLEEFASNCLSLQSSLSDQLKKYHSQVIVGEKNIEEFENFIVKYAKKLLKFADTRVRYQDAGLAYQHAAIWRPC